MSSRSEGRLNNPSFTRSMSFTPSSDSAEHNPTTASRCTTNNTNKTATTDVRTEFQARVQPRQSSSFHVFSSQPHVVSLLACQRPSTLYEEDLTERLNICTQTTPRCARQLAWQPKLRMDINWSYNWLIITQLPNL